MQIRGHHYIEGRWRPGSGLPLVSIDPADGKEVWKGRTATPEEVDSALSAARKALPDWSALDVDVRMKYLEAFAKRLKESSHVVATAISCETGKPLWEANTEVQAMVGKVNISYSAYGDRCKSLRQDNNSLTTITRHKPHGVVAVLGPFNFPGHLPNGHIVPALLAGNTIVFKPSEMTPLVAERAVEIWDEIGLPPGVLNLVQGGRDSGQTLVQHPNVDGLFFTGSVGAGKALSKHFGTHPGKILALELGGNNPLVVSKITDVNAAAYIITLSVFLTTGQRCTCARRLFLPDGELGDRVLERLLEITKNLKVGSFKETPEPFMGPLISAPAARSVVDAQQLLVTHGADMLLPMERFGSTGAFITPGIVDVTRLSHRPDEEVFGPLLQVIRYDTLENAIEIANRTAFGLSAGLLSDDASEWEFFRHRIRAGIVNWNMPLTGASSAMPFGGVGLSGNHRPSAYYAADYCAYPVASMENPNIAIPDTIMPGITL